MRPPSSKTHGTSLQQVGDSPWYLQACTSQVSGQLGTVYGRLAAYGLLVYLYISLHTLYILYTLYIPTWYSTTSKHYEYEYCIAHHISTSLKVRS